MPRHPRLLRPHALPQPLNLLFLPRRRLGVFLGDLLQVALNHLLVLYDLLPQRLVLCVQPLKVCAHRLKGLRRFFVRKGVAIRVAAAVGVVALLLAASLRCALLVPEPLHLALVPLLHGLHVLRARPLDVRQHVCVCLLKLVQLVVLLEEHGGEALHDGGALFHRPARRISRLTHLAPLLVSPVVLPPGRKVDGKAPQALRGALVQHLLLYTGLMRLEVTVVGGGGGGDEVAAVVRPLPQNQEAKRVLSVDRGVRKLLGVVLQAIVHVVGARHADAALRVHLSPRGDVAADVARVHVRGRRLQNRRGQFLRSLRRRLYLLHSVLGKGGMALCVRRRALRVGCSDCGGGLDGVDGGRKDVLQRLVHLIAMGIPTSHMGQHSIFLKKY